jgi:tRNA acetyltransferase TAN1
MIIRRHPENRADLKHPQLAVIVEVIRNMCCLSVLPEYFELRKYNLLELCAPEGGIKVVDRKGAGDSKIAAGKSGEVEEGGQEDDVGTRGPDEGKGCNSKTVAPDLKDGSKGSKGVSHSGDAEVEREGDENAEQMEAET